MITILVFDVEWIDAVTLDCPEYRRSPTDTAKFALQHIKNTTNPVIRTYTATVLEVIGEAIDYEFIPYHDVTVIYQGGSATFDTRGALVGWEYGLFNHVIYTSDIDIYNLGK
jgi:hypothetical protein